MGRPASSDGPLRLATRSYVPDEAFEQNVNATDDYLFVLPSSFGDLQLLGEDGDVLHDGPVSPGMVRVVVPGERSEMRARAAFASVMVGLPAAACHSAAAEVGADPRGRPAFGRGVVLRPRGPLHRMVAWLRDASATSDPTARDLVVTGLAIALLGAALDEHARRPDPAATGLTAAQQRRVVEFAEERIGGRLSVSDWAAAAGFSAGEFTRRFVVAFGDSPYSWFVARRVDAAMAYLRDTDLPLGDIAHLTGFSSQSHFTGAFRRRTGSSPGRWREWDAARPSFPDFRPPPA